MKHSYVFALAPIDRIVDMTDSLLLQEEHGADTTSPAKTKPQSAKPSKPSKPSPPRKRVSPSGGDTAAKKRRKLESALSPEEVLLSPNDQSSADEKPKVKKTTKKAAPPRNPPKSKTTPKTDTKTPESELSDVADEAVPEIHADASDSELSVLIDEDPRPTKKKNGSAPAEKKGRKPSAQKAKPEADLDPDQAEIKRLQGWLVKCGIRKLWGKELKPYESSKAKIKHLKEMLSDVGMSGRYSVEKANQIKEQRELRADIEAVQEGAERWGKNPDEVDSDGRTKPKRKLVRGAQVLDFLSSDGEETD